MRSFGSVETNSVQKNQTLFLWKQICFYRNKFVWLRADIPSAEQRLAAVKDSHIHNRQVRLRQEQLRREAQGPPEARQLPTNPDIDVEDDGWRLKVLRKEEVQWKHIVTRWNQTSWHRQRNLEGLYKWWMVWWSVEFGKMLKKPKSWPIVRRVFGKRWRKFAKRRPLDWFEYFLKDEHGHLMGTIPCGPERCRNRILLERVTMMGFENSRDQACNFRPHEN